MFPATVYSTVPFPDPLLLVVIHGTSLTAVHSQPADAVTENEPAPPLETKV
jgi:hypothetical protein